MGPGTKIPEKLSAPGQPAATQRKEFMTKILSKKIESEFEGMTPIQRKLKEAELRQSAALAKETCKCLCGKPGVIPNPEGAFNSAECYARYKEAKKPGLKPGDECRADALKPGQRFVCRAPVFPAGHPWRAAQGAIAPMTGHLVYATSGRARVALDKAPQTHKFTNPRTGVTTELTDASPREVDWAPETVVEVAAGFAEIKERALSIPAPKVDLRAAFFGEARR